MIRQTKISQSDLEKISAYIDNALPPKARVKFDARLARSLSLQKSLKEYTQLKAALKRLPCEKVPRNFILTEAEARNLKPKPLLYPTFGFAALTAMLLLALLFTSEFIFKNFSAPAVATLETAPMLAAAPQEKQADETTRPPLLFTWGASGFGKGGIGGGGAEGMAYGLGGGGITPGIQMAPLTADSTTQEEPTLAEEPAEGKKSGGGVEPLILGLREDMAGEVISVFPQERPLRTAEDSEPAASQIIRTVSPYLKLGLAGLALISLLLALIFYQKR